MSIWILLLIIAAVACLVATIVFILCPQCKIVFVADLGKAWSWFSVQAMAVSAGGTATWLALPPDLKELLPPEYIGYFTLIMMFVGIVGRMIKQGP